MAPSDRGDEKILSYGDVVLRRSDLQILGGPHFINDRILEFYFAHLSSSSSSPSLLLVPPAVSFWIANAPDPDSLLAVLSPLRLADRRLALFAVNDNHDVALAEGGAHWSLLAFHRPSGEFVHHDSCRGSNRPHAQRLARALAPFVAGAGRFVAGPTPQQLNGYDCGVHVMANARAIVGWHARAGEDADADGGESWFPDLMKEGANSVADLRGEVLGLITGLIEQQKTEGPS